MKSPRLTPQKVGCAYLHPEEEKKYLQLLLLAWFTIAAASLRVAENENSLFIMIKCR